jgi:hypothetical protein
LGAANSRFITIPDSDSFELVPEIAGRLCQVNKGNKSIVLVHCASLLGNVVAMDVAAHGKGVTSFDIGLAATIFDGEYLANRPWFHTHGKAIIETRRALAAEYGLEDEILRLALDAEDFANRLKAAGLGWVRARSLLDQQPLNAVSELEETIRGANPVQLPIMSSVLLLWKWRLLNHIDEGLLSVVMSYREKFECLLASSAIFASQHKTARAIDALERARAISPWDKRIDSWNSVLAHPSSSDPSKWDVALVTPGRRDYASALSWSLAGDLENS